MHDGQTARIRIAVLDDNADVAKLIATYLDELDAEVEVCSDPVDFLEHFQETNPDLLITDVRMPELTGVQILEEVKKRKPETEVIVITGHADKELAIQALRLGAFDLFEKPVERVELVEAVKRTMRFQAMLRERDRLAHQVHVLASRESVRWGLEALIGKSPALRSVVEAIRLLQKAENTPVLVTGESGTGKELVARAIHQGGPRAGRPFVAVNCAAMPVDLAESQLFGHVRGAFTGAMTNRKGHFEAADGGTLFLDEIGDMPAPVQTKLLRVLEDGMVQPVGAASSVHVNVRVLAAAGADLDRKLTTHEFRTDLFHRLAVFRISMPPLRDRKDDIPLLANHFLHEFAGEMGVPERPLSEAVLVRLTEHAYPGNVRELRNMIERALIVSGGRELTPSHFVFDTLSAGMGAESAPLARPAMIPAGDLSTSLRTLEADAIRSALEKTGGNVARTAAMLGITRAKLYRRLAALGQPVPRPGSSIPG